MQKVLTAVHYLVGVVDVEKARSSFFLRRVRNGVRRAMLYVIM